MEDVKNEMKKNLERQKKEIKTHFEGIKIQMKQDLQKSNEELLKVCKERDQLKKTVAFFKAENERLKIINSTLPKTFNEERYKIYTKFIII